MACITQCRCCGIDVCNAAFCNDCAQAISGIVVESTNASPKIGKLVRGILFKNIKEEVEELRMKRIGSNYPQF